MGLRPLLEEHLHLTGLEQSLLGNTPGKGSFEAPVGFSLWLLAVASAPQIITTLPFACLHFRILFFASIGHYCV